ncbi:paraquat-inducible protein A [Roseomonas sp. BN140053]|uniref:paraquat-inducible protein A n=1 Tax=Roseomonas sp. BN140053 TaxID=3391898 RepID=UPI0039EC032A
MVRPLLRAEHASPLRHLRECDGCGKLLELPTLAVGTEARCPRCDAVLRRKRANSLDTPLALALAGLVLYGVTMLTPFLSLQLLGRQRVSGVETGAASFVQDGFWLLSALVVATLVVVPLLRLLLLLCVLLGLRRRAPPVWLFRAFRWHERLGSWAMVEVFLFGALVSFTRLVDLAEVQIGPAAYGLAALALTLVAVNAALEPQLVWDALDQHGATAARAAASRAAGGGAVAGGGGASAVAPADAGGVASEAARLPAGASPGAAARPGVASATGPAMAARPGALRPISCDCCRLLSEALPGAPCPRCGAALHPRKPNSVARAWALILAALILYIPANAYPVMHIVTFGSGGPHTIVGGVVEFIQSGFWPLALIVFLASVAVPMLKLFGLMVMLLGIHRRSAARLRERTRLYRVVEAIGRWSMIDIFVVSVLISLVRFGIVANITAQVGAACFAAVVVLTIFAADAFDPRLMWDAAGQPDTARDESRR